MPDSPHGSEEHDRPEEDPTVAVAGIEAAVARTGVVPAPVLLTPAADCSAGRSGAVAVAVAVADGFG